MGLKVYKPLADYLTNMIGETVVYEHPSDWRDYEKNMKNDVYDIVFDGPHFAAWRIQSLRARALIRLPGSLRFVLVANRAAVTLNEAKDLVGHKICTLPSPNLGALTLFSMFPNAARQPEYYFVKGGFQQVASAMMAGRCDAAILRSKFYYKKTSSSFKGQTHVIQRSNAMINQGITVSQRVNPELHQKMVKSLILGDGQQAMLPILERFFNTSGSFIPSSKKDYRNQNLLRDNVIYGW
jgi:ABC-type phosphate/phosphonate transport system substrate-binding protein